MYETFLIPGETLIPGGKRFTLVMDMPQTIPIVPKGDCFALNIGFSAECVPTLENCLSKKKKEEEEEDEEEDEQRLAAGAFLPSRPPII